MVLQPFGLPIRLGKSIGLLIGPKQEGIFLLHSHDNIWLALDSGGQGNEIKGLELERRAVNIYERETS